MKIPTGTLREMVRQMVRETLEEDSELMEVFLEVIRVEVVKSITQDIRKMIKQQSLAMRNHQMQEDDGDYGGYGGAGHGGWIGNPTPTERRRRGMAAFYENAPSPFLDENFDPAIANQAFANEINQVKSQISNGRKPLPEVGDHQLDELMESDNHNQRRSGQKNARPQNIHQDQYDDSNMAMMEQMAMHAAVGDTMGPMPPGSIPMQMNEHYSRAANIHPDLVNIAQSKPVRTATPEQRLQMANMHPSRGIPQNNRDPMLDKPVTEIRDHLRSARNRSENSPISLEESMQAGARLAKGFGSVDIDGNPIPSINDPRFDGKSGSMRR